MKRFFKTILFLILVALAGFFVFQKKALFFQEVIVEQPAQVQQPITKIAEPKKDEPEIKILAVGDIMLDRGVEYMVEKYGGGDWQFPFFESASYLKGADILFGNLESVISDKGFNVGSLYSFRAEPESIEALTYAGFDIVSVANNHVFDYGRLAMEDSFNRLKQAGIEYVGAGFSKQEACSGIIKEVKGIKIAFLGFTNLGAEAWKASQERSGICWLDEAINQEIEKAKQSADIVVASFHWGGEYQAEPSEEQKYFAHLAIDSGADLVVGHHPHVMQPLEQYKAGWIVYSLGNFLFDQGFSDATTRSGVLEVLIKGASIQEVRLQKVKINEFFQPVLVTE